jgi:hypothetical protein
VDLMSLDLSIMKTIIIVTAGLVAMLSEAAAADLPRREPPRWRRRQSASTPLANIQLANIRLANTHNPS